LKPQVPKTVYKKNIRGAKKIFLAKIQFLFLKYSEARNLVHIHIYDKTA
jgi:hypothetical protein